MPTKKTSRKSSKRVSTKKYKSKSPLSLANNKYLVIILMVCALIPLTMIMQVFFGNFKSIAHNVLPEVFVGEEVVDKAMYVSNPGRPDISQPQFVKVSSSDSLKNLTDIKTIEAWVYLKKLNDAPMASVILSSLPESGYGGHWDLSAQSNGQVKYWSKGKLGYSCEMKSANTIPLNQWHLISIVKEPGDIIKLYINGNLDKTITCPEENYNVTTVLGIGGVPRPELYNIPINMTGYVNEVRISNVPRYSGNFTLNTIQFESDANTLALWHLNQNAEDSSGNANNGTVFGSVTYVNSNLYELPIPSPVPTNDVSKLENRVFVTSTTYDGNLGGLIGADAKCQERADVAGLGGNWKAWISNHTQSASSRLIHSDKPYSLLDRSLIADNWTDLTDRTLATAIDVDENNNKIATPSAYTDWNVWTGTASNGEISDSGHSTYICYNWTSTSNSYEGRGGSTAHFNSYWSRSEYTGLNKCYFKKHLYCFEQIENQPTPIPTTTATTKPTPTPLSNGDPRIMTTTLPWAYIGKSYNAVLTGKDRDINDTLSMSVTGLPSFLSLQNCVKTVNVVGKAIKYNCSIVSNGTIKLSNATTYQLTITLKDDKGGQDIKTLPLRVYTSIKPVATKYPIPTIRP